jgi:Rv2632c-like
MTQTHRWNIEVFIDEHAEERRTHAEARLHTNDETRLVGRGAAHRHPDDADVAEIGDELAVARALSDLAHQLLDAAAGDIEQVTHQRAHLRG